MNNKVLAFFVFGLLMLLSVLDLDAQCSMCKAVLETNMQNGEEAVGRGINDGIIYIMFVPYLLLGVVGYFMYKHYVKTNVE